MRGTGGRSVGVWGRGVSSHLSKAVLSLLSNRLPVSYSKPDGVDLVEAVGHDVPKRPAPLLVNIVPLTACWHEGRAERVVRPRFCESRKGGGGKCERGTEREEEEGGREGDERRGVDACLCSGVRRRQGVGQCPPPESEVCVRSRRNISLSISERTIRKHARKVPLPLSVQPANTQGVRT